MRDNSESSFVVLGLGSNIGDSQNIILDAVKALHDILTELHCASFYETEPLYITDQNKFINTAVSGNFSGSPRELLLKINSIESNFGRDRTKEQRWGERTLDIDILLFGDIVLNEPELEIPHPRLKERRFALEPLLELLPEALEPRTGLSYSAVCLSLPDQGCKKLLYNV